MPSRRICRHSNNQGEYCGTLLNYWSEGFESWYWRGEEGDGECGRYSASVRLLVYAEVSAASYKRAKNASRPEGDTNLRR